MRWPLLLLLPLSAAACLSWTNSTDSLTLATTNTTCGIAKTSGTLPSTAVAAPYAGSGVQVALGNVRTNASVELAFLNATSSTSDGAVNTRCALQFTGSTVIIVDNGVRVFPTCMTPLSAQDQYTIAVAPASTTCRYFRNAALLFESQNRAPSNVFVTTVTLATVGSQLSLTPLPTLTASTPSTASCLAVFRQPAPATATTAACGPCLLGYTLNKNNTACVVATTSARATVAWTAVGSVFNTPILNILASAKDLSDPADWGEGATATAAVDLQTVGGVRWRWDAGSRDTVVGLVLPARASLLCPATMAAAVLLHNRTATLLEGGVVCGSHGPLNGSETLSLFANASTYTVNLAVNGAVVARTSTALLTWLGGPLVLAVSFSNAPQEKAFGNAVTRGWAWMSQTTGRLTTAMPTTTTTTLITTPATTLPPPCCQTVLVFFLDFDRVFDNSPQASQAAFKDSVRAMLAYPRMFTPPIFISNDNISLAPGAVGQFADRTILVYLNLSDSTSMQRVNAALAKLYFLSISYLGYTFYPMPLGASYTVPTVTSNFNTDVWVFVLCSVGFFILVVMFFRQQNRLHQQRLDEDRMTLLQRMDRSAPDSAPSEAPTQLSEGPHESTNGHSNDMDAEAAAEGDPSAARRARLSSAEEAYMEDIPVPPQENSDEDEDEGKDAADPLLGGAGAAAGEAGASMFHPLMAHDPEPASAARTPPTPKRSADLPRATLSPGGAPRSFSTLEAMMASDERSAQVFVRTKGLSPAVVDDEAGSDVMAETGTAVSRALVLGSEEPLGDD